jgi:ParB/RepB/Spo0J family partition protein
MATATPVALENFGNIPVDVIDEPSWNSRVSGPEGDPGWEGFLKSIKVDGVRTPIRVRMYIVPSTNEQRYSLIYGSRRLNASRAVGLATIPAVILPPHPEGVGQQATIDQMVDNLRENVGRRDLSPYEQARAFADLRSQGLKLKDVASRVGVTEGHVSNLATIYLQADPTLLTEWKSGNPTATTNFLRELVAKEKDGGRQVQLFKEREALLRLGELDADKNDEDDDEGGGEAQASGEAEAPPRNAPAEKYHVTKVRYKALVKALKKARVNAVTFAAIDYLIGKTTAIKGIIEDKTEEPAA